jgi:methylaspartate ammonia-lyase
VREILIDALVKKYKAEIAEHKATLNIYLTNPVGIGEHPQHIEEMDKLIAKIADAEDKLETIKNI